MCSFSILYSSNWRLSDMSSHLSMEYSLYGAMPKSNPSGLYITSAMLVRRDTSLSMLDDMESRSPPLRGADGQHVGELLVEMVFVPDIVDLQAVACQVAQAGVDDVEGGLLLGNHQDGLPLHHRGRYQPGDDLGLARSRRPLDDDLVTLLYRGEDVLLRAVQAVDVHQVLLGCDHPPVRDLVLGKRCGQVGQEVGLVQIHDQVVQDAVDLPACEHSVEIPLDGARVHRVLAKDDVGDHLHVPGQVARELACPVVRELDGEAVVAVYVYPVLLVEPYEVAHERLAGVVLEYVVGERPVVAGRLDEPEDERVVVHGVTRIVHGKRDRAGVLLQDDGEQRERCTDVEVLSGHLPLNERVRYVQIVLTLVPQLPVHLADDLVEVLVDLHILRALRRVAQLEHPLPAEEQSHDIRLREGHQVEGVLPGDLPLVEQAVAPADVDELLLQLPESLRRLGVDVDPFAAVMAYFLVTPRKSSP